MKGSYCIGGSKCKIIIPVYIIGQCLCLWRLSFFGGAEGGQGVKGNNVREDVAK